ncbi:hypothetical protein A2125_01545 [Candidatus Woesebacteria bacterium GWB1_43_5]|uniref:Uncharacterized protein n=1 Tax=Candidatus Woesebacteria bacterium GWB1_43_5 TaxID=1802474 RepID=A0A1F7WSA8_9BACT|nr:MAG: hypothetical protein A2125_01545 [Candidatus Woesebacteria bacterium GWB1_43_5]
MKTIKTPPPVVIAVLTVVTVVFWSVFGIIRIVVGPETVKVDPKVIEPITPVLDGQVLSDLESRVFLSESEIPQTIIALPEETTSPTPSPVEIPEATQSAQTTETTATESGTTQ